MNAKNKILKDRIDNLKNNGFSLSNQMIAKWLCDKKIIQPNGIPYDRYAVFNKINSDYHDQNIEDAINSVILAVKKNKKTIWKYHQGVGAPRKK
jgi:hypothetical protein